jgi:uncharacterized protein (TIGR00369 family)
MDIQNPQPSDFANGLVQVTEGAWAGWSQWRGTDPFEDHAGPFYAKVEDGQTICGFMPGAQHRNGGGNIHGGALMTYADFALFMLARDAEGEGIHGVTVTMNVEFIDGAVPGRLLTARGGPIRTGKSLAFVRGTIFDEDRPVLAFSGTIKRIRRREG